MSIPTYATIGHPNEGKSSVISALTENETIQISPTPGQTTSCASYKLTLDQEAVLELIDTPGFQNPSSILSWMDDWEGEESDLIQGFLSEFASDPDFHHDRELLSPLHGKTGILYVVDASRPLREVDRQEMEILRRTGLPRLALLNFKTDQRAYLPNWKEALSRRFNLIREFDAHEGSFATRLNLMDALAELTPEHKDHLQTIKSSLERDWDQRIQEASLVVETLWLRTLRHRYQTTLDAARPEDPQFEEAKESYREDIRGFERKARKEFCRIFQHSSLPQGIGKDSIFTQELFADKVWKVLGLSRGQLATAGAVTAGAMGAGLDVAAGGITFGVFTAAGLLAGGIGSWIGTPKLGAKKYPFPGGGPLGKEQIVVGPFADPQLLFVLLDRSLLYLQQLMKWSHARRDVEPFLKGLEERTSLSKTWSDQERKTLLKWIKTHKDPGHSTSQETSKAFRALILAKLRKL